MPLRRLLPSAFFLLLAAATLPAQEYRDIAEVMWPSECYTTGVLFSNDSRYLVSTNCDQHATIRSKMVLWDVETGTERWSLTDTSAAVGLNWRPVCFTETGDQLIDRMMDYSNISDPRTMLRFLTVGSGTVMGSERRWQTVMTVTRQARHALITTPGSTGMACNLVRFDSGELVRTLEAVPTVARFTPDGRTLVAAYQSGSLEVLDVETGNLLLKTQVGMTGSYAFAVTPDATRAAVDAANNVIKIIDLTTGQVLQRLVGYPATAMDFSSDGNYLATAHSDGTVRMWNANTWNIVHTYTEYPAAQWCVSFSPDMRYIATGTYDGAVIIWHARYGSVASMDRNNEQASTTGTCRVSHSNSTASIGFDVARGGHVTLSVYNIRGEDVATLVDQDLEPGSHAAVWDAARFPSGAYMYRLVADGKMASGRVW